MSSQLKQTKAPKPVIVTEGSEYTFISGNTFEYKENFKVYGAIWSKERSSWIVSNKTGRHYRHVKYLVKSLTEDYIFIPMLSQEEENLVHRGMEIIDRLYEKKKWPKLYPLNGECNGCYQNIFLSINPDNLIQEITGCPHCGKSYV